MAAMAWYCIRTLGREGLRRRAEQGHATAAWLVDALTQIGWPAWRHPTAFTVVLDPPPDSILRRWHLPVQDGQCHYVCLPGRTIEQARRFVEELAEATSGAHHIARGQRKSHALGVARTAADLGRRGAA
jgi:histidine decarboxylase